MDHDGQDDHVQNDGDVSVGRPWTMAMGEWATSGRADDSQVCVRLKLPSTCADGQCWLTDFTFDDHRGQEGRPRRDEDLGLDTIETGAVSEVGASEKRRQTRLDSMRLASVALPRWRCQRWMAGMDHRPSSGAPT